MNDLQIGERDVSFLRSTNVSEKASDFSQFIFERMYDLVIHSVFVLGDLR